MKACSCERKHLDPMRGDRGGPIFCSNCDGVLMCHFCEQSHAAANIVTVNSYACWDHVTDAKDKAQE